MKRFSQSIRHALRGITIVYRRERNFRMQTALGTFTLTAAASVIIGTFILFSSYR
jgi:diacylglycerol kinase